MTDDLRARAIRLYDAFTHEHRDRRALLRDMTALAGSAAAAELLIAGIAASPAAAAQIAPDDARLQTRYEAYPAGDTQMTGYFAAPADPKLPIASVMVVHENRGLTAHIEDVARRVALAGYYVVAPDFLSPVGGTPKGDEDKAREMIGALDLAATTRNAAATLKWIAGREGVNGRAGAVGFCWGGAMIHRVAVAAGPLLSAGVSYYGPAPDPAEAPRVQAPLLLQLAGNDARVNGTALPWGEALKKAGKTAEVRVYPGVDHAFNNDTSAQRYNAEAAKLAWDRTLAFFATHLTSGR